MLICIGPKSSGKTLLLRRLQQPAASLHCNPHHEIFSTIPTVGVNIAHLALSPNKTLSISELGGAIAAIWPMHFPGCLGLVFVIDAANPRQVSCACIHLLEALKHEALQDTKFMVVLNKTDIDSAVKIADMRYLMRLEDIVATSVQQVTVIECSCLTGKGIKEIKTWLFGFVQ